MSYIGRGTDKISNIEILDNITFDGSSSYSITKSSVAFTPNSAQSLLISIDGVVQAGNFTVSGSTIDFGTAVAGTSTCDFILHYGIGLITAPSDGTVTEAKIGTGAVTTAKIADANVTSAKMFSGFANGITEADQFRLTANLTNPGTADITANLERVDDASFAKIGTGMTESSGVFSFPSTGLYCVNYKISTNSTTDFHDASIYVTSDGGSTFDRVTITFAGHNVSGLLYQEAFSQALVNVTNISNIKVKFNIADLTVGAVGGSTSFSRTAFTFIRLGDSQ